jgi:glycosyltransferase involved in cell wall biosynthesis
MARGCCVVASARGAIPELITHGINGILIEDTEPVAFRRAVVKLLGTPNSVFQMGRNAMIAASELPTLTGHAKSMIELYEKLIRKKSQ